MHLMHLIVIAVKFVIQNQILRGKILNTRSGRSFLLEIPYKIQNKASRNISLPNKQSFAQDQ